jgi:hypothetical protein
MKPLHTVICKCYYKFDDSNLKGNMKHPRTFGLEGSFYGGRCVGVAETKCACGREYYLFVTPGVNKYVVFDMALKEDLKVAQKKVEESFEGMSKVDQIKAQMKGRR